MRRTNIQTGMRRRKEIQRYRTTQREGSAGGHGDKSPPAIQRYGIGVLLGIIVLLLVGSALFSYPEKVTTTFTLTSQNPPAYATAPVGGQIEQLYVKNGQRGEGRRLPGRTVQHGTGRKDILHCVERNGGLETKGKPRRNRRAASFPPTCHGWEDVQVRLFLLPAGHGATTCRTCREAAPMKRSC